MSVCGWCRYYRRGTETSISTRFTHGDMDTYDWPKEVPPLIGRFPYSTIEDEGTTIVECQHPDCFKTAIVPVRINGTAQLNKELTCHRYKRAMFRIFKKERY